MTSRRTPTAEVRGSLVEAAAAVLERDGVAGLTVRAVAAEAGVAPMGVYNHLSGKDGLILAVLQRGFDGLRAAVAVPAAVPMPDRLRQSGVGYRRFALGNPTTYWLMFGAGGDKSAYAEALEPHAAPAFDALVEIVADGQRSGHLRSGDPTELARQIWSIVHGGVSLEITQNLDAEDADRFYEQLMDMVFRGVAPDPA